MKKYKLTVICAAAVSVAMLLGGCSSFKNKEAVQTGTNTAQSSSSGSTSSSGSRPASEKSGETSEEPSSQTQKNDLVIPESGSQPGPVADVETENDEFNKKFKDNPIDKKYIEEMNDAVSNLDMVNVSQKYGEIWQKEINYAYKCLEKYMETDTGKNPALYKAEQKTWESGKESSLKKINSQAAEAGGSMAGVNESAAVMDFYRSRAAKIYSELYTYNKDYTYKFSG